MKIHRGSELCLLAIIFVLFSFCVPVGAQQTLGAITGTVKDVSGRCNSRRNG